MSEKARILKLVPPGGADAPDAPTRAGSLGTRTPLVDVATVAEYLSASSDWVYAHADELGVRRLGTGPKSRLRFNLDDVDRLLSCPTCRESKRVETAPKPAIRRRRAPGTGTNVVLLPVRGQKTVESSTQGVA